MSSPWSETTIRSLSSSECHLTPAAAAFTAILSAFIGSVINGLANGWVVAFMTGWIAWFAIFRVLIGGLYMLYHSITNSWGPRRSRNDVDDHPPPYPPHSTGPQAGPPQSQSFNILAANENGYYASGQYSRPHHAIPLIPAQQHGQGEAGLDPSAPQKNQTLLEKAANIWPPVAVVRHGQDNKRAPDAFSAFYSRLGRAPTDLDRSVTALGWFALAYTALYAPVTQVLFVTSNASRHDIGSAKIVKGLTTAITALPLCIDCRVRYADRLPGLGRYAFNVLVSVSCLLQGAVGGALLVTGWMDVTRAGDGWYEGTLGRVIPAVYVVFALAWMYASFTIIAMRDGGRQGAGKTHWAGYIMDVLVGAFAGAFLAAPALLLYLNAAAFDMGSGPRELGEYLRCERQAWRRFAAVAP
jgi:hypothetical protein